jgi:hypothetical protein
MTPRVSELQESVDPSVRSEAVRYPQTTTALLGIDADGNENSEGDLRSCLDGLLVISHLFV